MVRRFKGRIIVRLEDGKSAELFKHWREEIISFLYKDDGGRLIRQAILSKDTAATKRKKLGSASVVKKKVSKKAPKAVGKKGTTRVQRKVGKVFTDARKLKNNLTVYERVKKLKKQMKQRMIVSVSVEANPVRVASAYSGSIFMPYTLTMDDAKKAVDWGINKAQPAINGLKNMKRKVDEKAKPFLPYVDMVLNVTGGGRGLPRGGGAKGTGNTLSVISSIKKDPRLVKAAEQMGKNKAVQQEADDLIQKFLAGNTNPGLGSKNLFGNISYLRGRDGARVFYRMNNGKMEILGKSSKANEQTVINVLKELYGK